MAEENTSGEKAEVEAYSGYKQGETPRKVMVNGKEFPVECIVFRRREFDADTKEQWDHFRVVLEDYGECDLYYKETLDKWELTDNKKPGGKCFWEMYVEGMEE